MLVNDQQELREPGGQAQEGNLAALLCTLSFATSVGLGERMEHGLRSAYIGLQLADALQLLAADREAVFYGALLKDAGCTSCGAALAAFFPDQPLPNLDMMLSDRSQLERMMNMLTRYVPIDGALPGRLAKLLSFVVHCQPIMRESVAGHCEVAELFARRLGFAEHVQRSVRFQWERWDGKGVAYGLKKDTAPVAARVLHLAQMVEFAHSLGGKEGAESLARDRMGARFDPEIVGAFLALSARRDFWQLLDEEGLREAILAMAPATDADRRTHNRTEAVCEALADLSDAKTGTAHGHSRMVADLAVDIGHQLGLDTPERTRLRRTALLHDLGTVALPIGILEKGSKRSAAEEEQFRLHPYYTQRILDEAKVFGELAADAAAHHERLDGKGYHRQLTAQQLTMNARILAVADRCAELCEQGSEPEAVLNELRRAGRELDGACCEALARSDRTRHARGARFQPGPSPYDLSERETEVLRLLAQGMSNPEIGEALVISRKTVEHHVEHILNKLGVTSRTAAVAYAVHSGLAWPQAD